MPIFIPLFLLSGFSIAVASVWFRYHILATGDHWLWIAFPLAVYGVVTSGIVFLMSRSRKPTCHSPLSLLAFLLIAIFIIFNAQTFLRPIFLTGTPLYPELGIIAANLAFGKMALSILVLYTILTLLFIATGSLTLRIARLSRHISTAEPGLRFALHFVTGLGIWVGILILYHWIGLLTAGSLIFAAVIILLSEHRFILEIGRLCLKKTESSARRNPLNIFFSSFLFFLIAFNVVETIRPIPTGYDDMTHYMNRVALIADRLSLPDGALHYNFELLAAGISIVTGESEDQLFALSFGTYGLLIGTLFIFLFGRAFFGFRAGLVAAAAFLSMPIGPALAILETKPDSLLAPLAVALVWFLVEAVRTRHLPYLFFACFTFGLAIGTKLTGAIFAPGLVFGFLLIMWTGRLGWLRTLQAALFGLFFFFLALAPWYLHGELNQAQLYLHPDTETTLSEDFTQELWSNGQKCSFLGQTEDMLRFDPEPGWSLREIIMAPWHMTMNRYVSLFATEFGFLYLALLPLGLIALFRSQQEWVALVSRPTFLIAVTAIGAITLWSVYAEHVVWYLYPVFPLLSILIAVIFEHSQKYRVLFWFLAGLLVLGLFGNTLVRMKFGSSEPRLRYAAGAISAAAYTESVFPGYPMSMEILNLYPEARIFVTGSRHWYGIRDNDKRAYMDTHLEAFSCLLNRYGADGTLAVLQRLDVRYVFFSKSLLSEIDGTSRPTFTKKIRELVEFSRTHLRVVWGSPSHIIYQIPPLPNK